MELLAKQENDLSRIVPNGALRVAKERLEGSNRDVASYEANEVN